MKERTVISTPHLADTLRSLAPGDYVHMGNLWDYGVIRQTASNLNISIKTKRTTKGITVMRQLNVPEPK